MSTTVERNTIKKLDEHPDWQHGFNSGYFGHCTVVPGTHQSTLVD